MLFQSPTRVLGSNPPPAHTLDDPMTTDTIATILDILGPIQEDCEALGLHFTLAKVNRLIKHVEQVPLSNRELASQSKDVMERLSDELDTHLFLAVDSEHVSYYQDFAEQWVEVIAQFPSVAYDVEEACKCFALNRYTACVFHLMRVGEAGLAAVAKRVGLVNSRPGWMEAITYIEGQLKKDYASMDELFKGDIEFLTGIAAHMRDVNVAWRRRVAHMESKYTEEEAERIYISTKAVMGHIATKLSEIEDG